MIEFWEEAFQYKQEMWGFQPAHSAIIAKDFFVEKSVKNVLVPGIGYGRNAKVFQEVGMSVTGIEISKTAIELAEKHYGQTLEVHHGSVTDMPFDDKKYDAVFCYGLIHLLDSWERQKLVADCYNQLVESGYMIFTAVTKEARTYRQGKKIGKDRFEMFGGVKMFFYDLETIKEEFGKFGLFDITEVDENYPFYLIKCQKKDIKYEQ